MESNSRIYETHGYYCKIAPDREGLVSRSVKPEKERPLSRGVFDGAADELESVTTRGGHRHFFNCRATRVQHEPLRPSEASPDHDDVRIDHVADVADGITEFGTGVLQDADADGVAVSRFLDQIPE
jgi:hypothetical protein